jgi:hypothetical protein
MEDEGLFLDDLDLTAVTGREELAELLRTVHARADSPSYRSLSNWASRKGKPALPKTTVGDILRGEFPRKAKMLVFLEACGVPAGELKHWRAAWERIAAAEQRRQQEKEAADFEQRYIRVLEEAAAQAVEWVREANARAEEVIAKAERETHKLIEDEAADLKQQRGRVETARTQADAMIAEAEQRATPLRQRAEADVLATEVSVQALAAKLARAAKLVTRVREAIALEPAGDGFDELDTLRTELAWGMAVLLAGIQSERAAYARTRSENPYAPS